MSGFKTQTKRNRELAKLDKRRAKDEKRALRKAERAASTVGSTPPVAAAPPTARPQVRHDAAASNAGAKALTLAEAVERWKITKVTNPNARPGRISGKRAS